MFSQDLISDCWLVWQTSGLVIGCFYVFVALMALYKTI